MNDKTLNEARTLIAGFFKNRRIELGITQEQLAETSGMGVATISRFESGRYWLNSKQLLLLCHHLSCYPFFVPKESSHPLATQMRQAMDDLNKYKKPSKN